MLLRYRARPPAVLIAAMLPDQHQPNRRLATSRYWQGDCAAVEEDHEARVSQDLRIETKELAVVGEGRDWRSDAATVGAKSASIPWVRIATRLMKAARSVISFTYSGAVISARRAMRWRTIGAAPYHQLGVGGIGLRGRETTFRIDARIVGEFWYR